MQKYNDIQSPTSKKKKMKSRAIRLLGGEDVLNDLSICFAERIANDNILGKIYANINSISLMQMQKQFLLFALDDGFVALKKSPKEVVCSQQILQCHVRLGLMERRQYFDRMTHILNDVLTECQVGDLGVAIRIQRRFEATRPLLQVTHEHLRTKSNRFRSIRFPKLGLRSIRSMKRMSLPSRRGNWTSDVCSCWVTSPK